MRDLHIRAAVESFFRWLGYEPDAYAPWDGAAMTRRQYFRWRSLDYGPRLYVIDALCKSWDVLPADFLCGPLRDQPYRPFAPRTDLLLRVRAIMMRNGQTFHNIGPLLGTSPGGLRQRLPLGTLRINELAILAHAFRVSVRELLE